MKFSLLLVMLIACCFQLKAQTDEQIRRKSDGFMENRRQKTAIRAVPMPFGSFPLTENHLIVIGQKIFKGTDPALKSISKDSLQFVSSVKDTSSISGIKQILFYRIKSR